MSMLLDQMSGEESDTPGPVEESANEESVEEEGCEPVPIGPSGEGEAIAAPSTEGVGVTSVEEEADIDEEQDRKKARNFRGRWDHLNEQERRVVELTTKRGLTLSEACRAVYGAEGAPAAVKDVAETRSSAEADPFGELDRNIAEQQGRLEELKRKKTEAKGDLASYDQAVEAYLEVRDQLRELQAQRRQVTKEESQRRIENQQRLEAASQEALQEEFPDALTAGTELFEACNEELAYLRETNSPLIHDPAVQYKVARRMARAIGYGKQASIQDETTQAQGTMNTTTPIADNPDSQKSQPAGAANAAVARRTVRPVPTGGSPVEAPVATLERRVAGARSSGEMLELMREIGTPFEALLKR